MRVLLVHGIHSVGPNTSVEELRPYLEAEGFKCVYPDYGYELGIQTSDVNPMIEGTLMPFVEPGDLWVGHSNGCAIGYHLMQMGAPIAGAAFINAALEQNIVRPASCRFIDVYYNEGDSITVIAQIASKLRLVDKVYGEMGHSGYSGKDSCIHNVDCGRGPVPVSGHSDLFAPEKLKFWGPKIASRLKDFSQT